jgi:hypothetical protein
MENGSEFVDCSLNLISCELRQSSIFKYLVEPILPDLYNQLRTSKNRIFCVDFKRKTFLSDYYKIDELVRIRERYGIDRWGEKLRYALRSMIMIVIVCFMKHYQLAAQLSDSSFSALNGFLCPFSEPVASPQLFEKLLQWYSWTVSILSLIKQGDNCKTFVVDIAGYLVYNSVANCPCRGGTAPAEYKLWGKIFEWHVTQQVPVQLSSMTMTTSAFTAYAIPADSSSSSTTVSRESSLQSTCTNCSSLTTASSSAADNSCDIDFNQFLNDDEVAILNMLFFTHKETSESNVARDASLPHQQQATSPCCNSFSSLYQSHNSYSSVASANHFPLTHAAPALSSPTSHNDSMPMNQSPVACDNSFQDFEWLNGFDFEENKIFESA